jgi:hypothetical protein
MSVIGVGVAATFPLVVCGSRYAPGPGPMAATFSVAEIRAVLLTTFHVRPNAVAIGGDSAHKPNAIMLTLPLSPRRNFAVAVFVYRRSADAIADYRSMGGGFVRSGFAVARLRNVIVTASRPDARIGKPAPPFARPALVSAAIERLRSSR